MPDRALVWLAVALLVALLATAVIALLILHTPTPAPVDVPMLPRA